MLHAVIVDDEINGLRSLELLLGELNQEVKIVGATTNGLESIALINTYRPDIVFLDISMPHLDGFEVLERLEFQNFYLVFTTAHRQYALRALKQGATDYLLKPIDLRELIKTVERIKQKMNQGHAKPDIVELLRQITEVQNARILLPTKLGSEYVSPNNIIYIEADSNYAKVFLTNGQSVQVTNLLKDFEQQLCKKEFNFIRVHNSYIINVDYVSRYIKDDGGFAVLQGKKTIPISRQRKDDFLKLINFSC